MGPHHYVVPVEPGEYVLIGGSTTLPDSIGPKSMTSEYVSSRLGRVELSNKDILEYYEEPCYQEPNGYWEKDDDGVSRWVEISSGYWTTCTRSRVVGHYVACDVITPGTDAAGKPLWAGFRIAPGEVVLLRTVGFADIRPDYSQCRSTALFGGEWSCPVRSVTLLKHASPDLQKCRDAAEKWGFSPQLVQRLVARDVTPGSLLQGPHRRVNPPEEKVDAEAYAFDAELEASSAVPAAPHTKADAAKGP